MMKVIQGTLIVIGMIAVGVIIGVALDMAQAKEAGYWNQLNTHVLTHGGTDHECEYDPSWCNAHYREFLLKNRGLKKSAK